MFDKFTSTESLGTDKFSGDTFFDQNTLNLFWGTAVYKDTQYVAKTPNGEEPATFQDSDFVLSGCKAEEIIYDPAQKLVIFGIGSP